MAKLFFGGTPTEPDVKALREAFPALKPGDVITYERAAEVIRCNPGSSRFVTVLVAFRKTMARERNIDFRAVRGQGLQVLAEGERTSEGVRDFASHVRGVGRAFKRVSAVDTAKLDEVELRRNDHARRFIGATYEAGRGNQKAIATVFSPPKQLPRLVKSEG